MRILGIDPGLAKTGWGIIDFNNNHLYPVEYSTIKTSTASSLEQRICSIALEIKHLIKTYQPEAVSIEEIYFLKNISSAIPVAKVIGSIMYAVYQEHIPIRSFTPLQIKSAVTGNGKAEKEQVQEMVRLLLGLTKIPKPDHAADALAAAVCYHTMYSAEQRMGLI